MTSPDALTRPPATIAPGVGREPRVDEIGSDFELVDDRYLGPPTRTPFPWADSAAITYVESGRQALALAEAELSGQGHSHLHVPSYLCDTMIAPFHRAGWTLTTLPVNSDLAVDPADLLSQVRVGALLHTPYFGRQESPAILKALDTLRRRGVVVVVDETHRLFSGPSQGADIRVASLRKLLPVHDGGYVTGLGEPTRTSLATASSESEPADLHQLASVSKSQALAAGDDSKAHLAMFAKAEEATAHRTQPAPISSKSLSLLHRLDMGRIRRARLDNSSLLSRALGQSDRFRLVNPPAADLLPSHLVLETDEVSRLRKYLTGQQIYCPIHWPPSDLLPREQAWPRRYLSLPIDHRYGEQDMLRMAAEVRAFFAGDSPNHRRRTP